MTVLNQYGLDPTRTLSVDHVVAAAQLMADMRRAMDRAMMMELAPPPRPDPAALLLALARREFEHRMRQHGGPDLRLEYLRWETLRPISLGPGPTAIASAVYDPTEPAGAVEIRFHAIAYGPRGRSAFGWRVDGPGGDAQDLAAWLRHNGPQPFFDLFRAVAREIEERRAWRDCDYGARRFRDPREQAEAYAREQAFRYEFDRNARPSQQQSDAFARGEKLLREWLSPEQLAQFDRHHHFDVIGSKSKRRYRINPAAPFNVHLLDANGHPEERICFMPEGGLVEGDVMLAQKIALECNEPAAMKVANREWLGPRPRSAETSWIADRVETVRGFFTGHWR